MSITSTFDHRALPYGVFICGDGTYVLHDRRYRPLVKCRGGSLSVRAHYHRRQQWQQCTVMLDTGSATPCSPTERIKHVDRVWFYYNRTSPRFDRKTRKYVQQIVEAIPALAAEINRRNVESSSESPEPVESDMSIHPFPSPTPCEDDEPDEPALIRATPFKWTEPSAIPQRQWLYGRSLIRQQLSLTVAHPGIGKSSLTITEALAIASKRMLLHDLPHQRCRVWLWNGEDPADELQRRITAAALHHKIPPTELDGWLFVDSGRQVPIVIAHATRDGTVIAEPVRDALVATIIENRIDVLIIDPFVSCHSVSENDNGAIDAVAKTYAQIADATGCAIHLVHHSRKTGGDSVDAEHARGASALLGAVRSARTLNVMTADEAAKAGIEERHRYVRIDDGKANLAPRSDTATWIELKSVFLGNGPTATAGDSVGVPVRWQWPNPMEGMTGDKLVAARAAIAAGGPWRENPQATDWVGRPIADALRLALDKPSDRAKVRGIVKQWIACGMLAVVTGKDDKRRERPFVELGRWEERSTLTPGHSPRGVAAPPPPATP